jgi:hypothetical protein
MAWYPRKKATVGEKPKVTGNHDYDDDGEEIVEDFETQVLDLLADMMGKLKSLERKYEKLEKDTEARIDRLEFDLRRKNEYVETLLAKLLDKDWVAGSFGKATSTSSGLTSSSKSSSNGVPNAHGTGTKLVGPAPGKLTA